MTTGQIIKMLREKKGMTQEQLAEEMGYSHKSSINKIEMGKADLPQSKLYQFAKIFGVAPCELLGTDDSETGNAEPNVSETYNIILKVFGKQTFELVHLFNGFNEEGKEKLLDFADDMMCSGKYKKDNQNAVVSEEGEG